MKKGRQLIHSFTADSFLISFSTHIFLRDRVYLVRHTRKVLMLVLLFRVQELDVETRWMNA